VAEISANHAHLSSAKVAVLYLLVRFGLHPLVAFRAPVRIGLELNLNALFVSDILSNDVTRIGAERLNLVLVKRL